MKVKDQISFYDAIKYMDLEDLDKILGILIRKEMTEDNKEKLRMLDIAIKGKQRGRRYHDKI